MVKDYPLPTISARVLDMVPALPFPTPKAAPPSKPLAALDLILSAASPAERLSVYEAWREGRFCTWTYVNGQGQACLLHHLKGFTSRADRLAYYAHDERLLDASSEVIAAWDRGVLTPDDVEAALRRVARGEGKVRVPGTL